MSVCLSVCYHLISTTARSCYILSISTEAVAENARKKANCSKVMLLQKYNCVKQKTRYFGTAPFIFSQSCLSVMPYQLLIAYCFGFLRCLLIQNQCSFFPLEVHFISLVPCSLAVLLCQWKYSCSFYQKYAFWSNS